MKRATVLLALIATVLTLPCAAQTGAPPGNLSPQAARAALDYFFRAGHDIHRFFITPQQRAHSEAVLAKINALEHAGAKALRDGDYAAAEADFRESINTDPEHSTYYELAGALTGQGRVAEAIGAYREGIYGPPFTTPIQNDIPIHGQFNPNIRTCPGGGAQVDWMKYALLLSQTGQGAEAVIIYKKALPLVPDAGLLSLDAPLASGTLSAAELQAAAHIAVGLCATFSGSQYDKAMGEFEAARHLRPDAPLTNYYFAYGWQNLDPRGAARRANAVQAKAALGGGLRQRRSEESGRGGASGLQVARVTRGKLGAPGLRVWGRTFRCQGRAASSAVAEQETL